MFHFDLDPRTGTMEPGCARLQLAFEINEFISRAGFSKELEIDGFDVDEGDYAVVLDVL